MDWGEGLLGRAQAGASAGLLSPPSCPQAASVLLSQGGHSLGRGLPLLTGSSQAARVLLPEGSFTVNLHRGGVGGRFVGEGSEEQVLESHKFCHLRPAVGTGLGSPSPAAFPLPSMRPPHAIVVRMGVCYPFFQDSLQILLPDSRVLKVISQQLRCFPQCFPECGVGESSSESELSLGPN